MLVGYILSENLLRPLPDILVRAVRLNASREMLSWVFAGKEYKRRAYGIISTRSSKWSCDRTERCETRERNPDSDMKSHDEHRVDEPSFPRNLTKSQLR